MRHIQKILLIILLIAPSVIGTAQDLPPIAPNQSIGDIVVSGSPSLVVMSQNLALRYNIEGFLGTINVTPMSTTEAIAAFCSGQIDIALADRQVTPQEASDCSAAGRSPVGMRVATDALSVVVSPQNRFVEVLTAAQLQQIFSGAPSWADISPTWPADIIKRYGPGSNSETFISFASTVFGGDTRSLTTAIGVVYNDDTSIGLTNIAGSEAAIGFFRTADVRDSATLVRSVPVDGVAPSAENIFSGAYPLSRPLILYSAPSVMQNKGQVADFLNYYLTNVGIEITSVGLYPVAPAEQRIAVNTWLAAMGQTVPEPTMTNMTDGASPPDETADAGMMMGTTQTSVASFSEGVLPLLIDARTDLEFMATELLGSQRPPGWSGSLDVNDPQLPILTRLDVELLAAMVFGAEERPNDWFGPVSTSQIAVVRDIRHDVELLADAILGESRPFNWVGGNPLYRCSRSTQALVQLLENVYEIETNPYAENYCAQLETDIARFTEVNLVGRATASAAGGVEGDGASAPAAAEIQTNFAVGFLTRSGSPRAGVVPLGEPITPVARSYARFSNMMLVEGEGFLVFIEYTNTALTAEEFEMLPDESEMDYEAYCEARWCDR